MRRTSVAVAVAVLVTGAGVVRAQWDEPMWGGQRKGEGAVVVRDGAPGYESKSSTDVKKTFKRGDAVAGMHKEFIAVTYEFFEENGRVRVVFPKEDSVLMEDAWMDPDDLLTFVYDCCDADCIPVKGSLKRSEWNPCFKEGINKARAQMASSRRDSPPSGGREGGSPSRSSSSSKEKPLTNDAIVAMVKADLGDDLVIAKIQQAPREALDVSPEALVALKGQGVSKAVLDAMIKRAGN